MTGVGSALLAWLTGGSTLGALAKVLLAVCGLVVGLVYRRYLGILGAESEAAGRTASIRRTSEQSRRGQHGRASLCRAAHPVPRLGRPFFRRCWDGRPDALPARLRPEDTGAAMDGCGVRPRVAVPNLDHLRAIRVVSPSASTVSGGTRLPHRAMMRLTMS